MFPLDVCTMTPLYFDRIKHTAKATIHHVIQLALELLINVFQCSANPMDFIVLHVNALNTTINCMFLAKLIN